MEQNFTKVAEIAADGVKQPDWIVQHINGWYARVRVQRVCKGGCPINLEYGVKPGMRAMLYVAECDANGVVTGDPIECQCVITPPRDGKDIDWAAEKKRVVRHALDQLLVERASLPELDERVVPLTR